MKRIIPIVLLLIFLISGCEETQPAHIVATTLPVYEFTALLCEGTDITVDRLITESVSCLHDYTLQVKQTKKIEAAELVVISGAGLESFMSDILPEEKELIIATGIPNEEEHDHEHDHEHSHESDPHLWLSVTHAKEMCENICAGLIVHYPQYKETFENNKNKLLNKINDVEIYGESQLSSMTSRKIITFHDGFGHMAEEYGLTIIKAIEEESGSEASAKELTEIISLIEKNDIKAVFTETNGSDSAANIIARECGIPVYTLDMAMSGDSWFDAMYKNIDTLKEALK
ncbi:MAG: zinc ABC transporter substrate-binding protein [Oscillospiraceae bacterium]|nr:zinc ABC transporter substrate-binding protein [Oscillospiraceae bacterium]